MNFSEREEGRFAEVLIECGKITSSVSGYIEFSVEKKTFQAWFSANLWREKGERDHRSGRGGVLPAVGKPDEWQVRSQLGRCLTKNHLDGERKRVERGGGFSVEVFVNAAGRAG
jgi:hypothetical protein